MTLVCGSRDWELEPSKHWEAVTESSQTQGSCLIPAFPALISWLGPLQGEGCELSAR